MATGICSVGIDLDPIDCYYSIHGSDERPDSDPVYEQALPRLLDLLRSAGVRATFFVVGRDAQQPRKARLLERAVAEGHELANHTLDHPYSLPDLSDEELRYQIGEASSLIEAIAGECVGFRAPGYNIDERTLRLLARSGYEYDSSIFPCPPYYFAKAGVMALLKLRGRPSGSSMVKARTLLAPLGPYTPRPDAIHRRARARDAAGPLELPMCVLPLSRWPVIGTSLIVAGRAGARLTTRAAMASHRRFVNLELHGIDLVDPGDPGLSSELVAQQPDLRRSLSEKEGVFRAVLGTLSQGGFRFLPCREAAAELRS